MAMEPVDKYRALKDGLLSVFGFFFAPISDLYGFFLKEVPALFSALFFPEKDFTDDMKNTRDTGAAIYPFMKTASRVAGICMAGLCLAGFLGALLFPIPGIAPLYLATLGAGAKAIAILKAYLLLNTYTVAARTVSGGMAAVFDASRTEERNKKILEAGGEPLDLRLSVVKAGLCGEFPQGLHLFINKIKKYFGINYATKKDIKPAQAPTSAQADATIQANTPVQQQVELNKFPLASTKDIVEKAQMTLTQKNAFNEEADPAEESDRRSQDRDSDSDSDQIDVEHDLSRASTDSDSPDGRQAKATGTFDNPHQQDDIEDDVEYDAEKRSESVLVC